MKFFRVLSAIGLLVGMIVGAGMFALPYTVFEAGIFWSVLEAALVFVLIMLFHVLYGKVLLERRENHRLPGYVRRLVGEKAYAIALASRVFSYFGFFLAYGVLGGKFLFSLFPTASTQSLTILFFLFLSPFIALRLMGIGRVNLILSVPLILFPFILFFVTSNTWDFSNLAFFKGGSQWFLPYGVFLFALSGASVIPEVRELFSLREKKLFFLSIVGGTGLALVTYVLFVVSILGVGAGAITDNALSVLGGNLFISGVLVGIVAIITSYLALALELRYTFEYDLGISPFGSWVLVAFVPLLGYLAGMSNFVGILKIVGAFGVGIEGMFIVLLAQKTHIIPQMLAITLHVLITFGALIEIAGAVA